MTSSREQSELASIPKPVHSIYRKTDWPLQSAAVDLKVRPPSPASTASSSKPLSVSRLKSRSVGFFCVSLCIISWIGIAELEPVLFAGTAFSDKPFFLQYVANSMLALCVIPWAILEAFERSPFSRKRIVDESLSVLNAIKVPSYESIEETRTESAHSLRALILSAVAVSALNSLQNYLWFLSLYRTIAAVNTTIYQMQCVFVLLFSVWILGHKPTASKILSVVVSAAGVALISCFGSESEDNPAVEPDALGVALCLSASAVVALMTVTMHRVEQTHFHREDSYQKLKDMLFFQFLMGAAVCSLWWPAFAVLDALEIEPFAFPEGGEQWTKLIAFSALSLSFIVGYLVGITYSGALFMSVGTLLVVPVSYAVDLWLYDLELSAATIAGTVCVVAGFLLMQKGSG